MNRKRLIQGVNHARTPREFLEAVYDAIPLDPKHAIEWEGERPKRVLLFTEDFDPFVAEVLLNHLRSHELFGSVQELRVVATRIPRKTAEEFRRFNPDMRIVWMSSKDWIERPRGSANPADLTVPV